MDEPSPGPVRRPHLTSISAHLFVSDVLASCAFYATLGFTTGVVYGDPVFYAQVHRDAARLALRFVDEPARGMLSDETQRDGRHAQRRANTNARREVVTNSEKVLR